MAATFNDVINSDKPTLVDFYATWCGPCRMMAPELEKLKAKLGDAVTILKIDIDKHPDAAAAFSIQGVPTLIVFKGGTPRWRQSGAMGASQLEGVLKPYLA